MVDGRLSGELTSPFLIRRSTVKVFEASVRKLTFLLRAVMLPSLADRTVCIGSLLSGSRRVSDSGMVNREGAALRKRSS